MCSNNTSLSGLHSTPCGESFFEGNKSVSTSLSSSLNKENNIPTNSKSFRKLSGGNNSLPVGLADCSVVKTQQSVSTTSASITDDMNKDSLLLTELLDSSDDEWANTCVLDTNGRQKKSSTPATTMLNSSANRINSVVSTPYSQQPISTMSFKGKPPTTQRNNLNSSFTSPQRINTIPNNGNDSKL